MESSSTATERCWKSKLPWIRYTSVVIFLVALDSLICVALWLGGGSASYLRHSVEDFSFSHSTFDLAVVAVARGLLLVLCLYYLERYSLLAISGRGRARRSSVRKYSRICRAGVFVAAGVSIVYVIVKGCVILSQIANGGWDSVNAEIRMHVTYKILCVFSFVFPLLEVGVGVASWFFLGRLVRMRRLELLINAEDGEEGEEEDEKEVKKKKKADFRRLLLLAKPVSIQLTFCCTFTYILCALSLTGIPFDGTRYSQPDHLFWCLLVSSVPIWQGH